MLEWLKFKTVLVRIQLKWYQHPFQEGLGRVRGYLKFRLCAISAHTGTFIIQMCFFSGVVYYMMVYNVSPKPPIAYELRAGDMGGCFLWPGYFLSLVFIGLLLRCSPFLPSIVYTIQCTQQSTIHKKNHGWYGKLCEENNVPLESCIIMTQIFR